MLDDLRIEIARERARTYFEEAIDRGGGPKAVARELASLGVSVKERTVASWREGRYFPGADVAILLAARFHVSLDRHVFGEALERTLADQLTDHDRRLERLEARLEGWEIEESLARGQFVSGNEAAENPAEAWTRWLQRVAELEAAVDELRKKEA